MHQTRKKKLYYVLVDLENAFDRVPRRNKMGFEEAGVTELMAGEAGWCTTSRKIGLPSLARVMGVGRQQQLVAGSIRFQV